MAFNINAHVILSGPKNLKAIQKKIKSGIGGVKASVNLNLPKNLSKQLSSFNRGLLSLNKNITTLQSSATSANTHLARLSQQFNALNKSSGAVAKSQGTAQNSLKNTAKQVGNVRNEIQAFGKDAALAIRRFSAFTVATGVVFGFVRAVQSATKAAVEYEREITKVIQVTGAGGQSLGRLNNTIKELSVTLGVDANELANLARVFAQTGQTVDQVRDSLRAVARSSLAPSFGEMKNTAEGLIAALAQFNIAAKDSEAVLSSINAVSKRFAVEAEDLVSVIRRAGGVFSQAAGDFDDPKKSLNELIGIFTAVRSTTRESADTIAVGLRTIFTRIQRRGTIEFLRQFNIELIDAKGNFIGLFPAFEELSRGLGKIIRQGDAVTLSNITEELGGIRQVGKLIPAITNFNKALEATKVAGAAAAEGLGKDVALALQPLGKRFDLVKERFNAFVRDISQSKTFQNLAKVALSLANAFLSVAETLKPLLPLITTFATIKLSKGLFEFGKGFIGGFGKGGGAAGAGETLGGGISGGAGREKRAAATGAQQALTAAVKSNTTAMGTNTTALQGVNTALQNVRTTLTSTTTQIIGAVGNLINALNRGGGGFGAFGRTPKKFAKGGAVSGPSHAQGGVPAILEGGEYVIPKGYANGGRVKIDPDEIGGFFLGMEGGKGEQAKKVKDKQVHLTSARAISSYGQLKGMSKGSKLRSSEIPKLDATELRRYIGESGPKQRENLWNSLDSDAQKLLNERDITRSGFSTSKSNSLANEVSSALTSGGISSATRSVYNKAYGAGLVSSVGKGEKIKLGGGVGIHAPLGRDELGGVEAFREQVFTAVEGGIGNMLESFAKNITAAGMLDFDPAINTDEQSARRVSEKLVKDNLVKNTIAGFMFEGIIEALTGAQFSGGTSSFDFEQSALAANRGKLQSLFKGNVSQLVKADAKPKPQSSYIESIRDKVAQDLKKGDFDGVYMAAGGNVFKPKGTDTVPAMLTPGEFVVNKSSAQKIGYGNLGRMNHMSKGGVAAKGNVMQYFADGSGGGVGGSPPFDLNHVMEKTDQLADMFASLQDGLGKGIESFDTFEDGVTKVIKVQRALIDNAVEAGASLEDLAGPVEALLAMEGELQSEVGKQQAKEQAAAPPSQIEKFDKRLEAGVMKGGPLTVADAARTKPPEISPLAHLMGPTDLGIFPDPPDFDPLKIATKTMAQQLAAGATETQAAAAAMEAVDSALTNTVDGAKYLAEEEKKLALETQALVRARKKELIAAGVESKTASEMATREVAKSQVDPRTGKAKTATQRRGDVARGATTQGAENIGVNLGNASAKAGADLGKLTSAVGSGVTAVGAWTAALSGMDFSSPTAAFASLGTLGFAVNETKNALTGLGGAFPKLASSVANMIGLNTAAAASEAAETASNVASTASEGAEITANNLSTASELAEAKANAQSTLAGGFKSGMGEGLQNMFGGGKGGGGKGAKAGKGLMGRLSTKLGGGKVGNLMKGIGPALKGLTPQLAKLSGFMGKLAVGGGIGAVASMLIGPIGNAITDGILGAKVEIAPGVKGRRGASKGAAQAAGALVQGAQGAAMGAAVGAAIGGPIGAGVGAAIGGLAGAIRGAITEGLAQAEFNAFADLQDSTKTLAKSFQNLAKLGDAAGPAAIGKVNQDIQKTMTDVGKAFETGKARRLGEHITSFSGMFEAAIGPAMGAVIGGPIGLAAAGVSTAVGAATGGVTLQDRAFSDIGSEGFFSSAANFFDKMSAGIPGVGSATGSTDRVKARARTGEAKLISESLKSAASQLGPEVFKQLDESLQSLVGNIASELSALGDTEALTALSEMSTVAPDLGEAETSQRVNDSFTKLNKTLQEVEGPTGAFAKELNNLVGNALKMHLIKDVASELEILEKSDPKAAEDLAIAYDRLNQKVDFGKSSVQEIEAAIAEVGAESGVSTKRLSELVQNQKANVVEMAQQAATMQLVKDAARAARKAMDAFAAGLDQFGAKTSGIANRIGILGSQIENEFAQITGEKVVGQLQQFNPFENVAAATDEEIDAGIGQLRGLGGEQEGQTAFREMGSLIKAQRDLPLVMKGILDGLITGRGADEEISNQEVTDAVEQGLKDADINLPPNVMKSLMSTIGQGVTSRQGGGGGVFSITNLEKLFTDEGDVLKLLGEASAKAAEQLGASLNALQKFQNELLKVAALQQKIAKHRLDSELAIMSKQESIRDRINSALGKTPDALQQATGDLQKRLSVLVKGGVAEGGTAFGGSVLDPTALFGRLEELEGKRDARRTELGLKPGQTILDASEDGGGAKEMTDQMRKNSDELQRLNSEINGTEAALKELANDTRMLAAIESKIRDQQAREAASKGTVGTMLDALNKLQKGEMSREDFNKQFARPLDSMEKLGAGEDIDFSSAVDLIQRLEGGDKLVAGRFQTKARQIAEAEGRGGDEGRIKEIMANMINNLRMSAGAAGVGMAEAGGLPGFGQILQEELMNIVDAQGQQENLGEIMQNIGNSQVAILDQTMDKQQKQLQVVLQTAEKGFQKAAADFQAAVTEFAIMRGGIDEGAEIKANEEIQNAQKAVEDRKKQIEEAKASQNDRIDNAATTAANEAKDKGLSPEEVSKARQDAITAERTATNELIKDLERKLVVEESILDRRKKKLQVSQQAAAAEQSGQPEQKDGTSAPQRINRATAVGMVDEKRKKLLGMDQSELEAKASGLGVSTRGKFKGWRRGKKLYGVKSKEDLAEDVQRAELEKEAKGLGVSTTTTSQVAAEAGWFGMGAETKTSTKEKTLGRLQEDILRKGGGTPAQEKAKDDKAAEEIADKTAKEQGKEKNKQKAADGNRGAAAGDLPLQLGDVSETANRAATSQLQDIENSSSASLGTLIDLVKGIFDCVCGAKAVGATTPAATRTVGPEEQKVLDKHRATDEGAQHNQGVLRELEEEARTAAAGNVAAGDSLATPAEEEERRVRVNAMQKRQQEQREKELQEARARDRGATAGSMDVRSQVGSATQMGQPSAQKEALKEKIKQQVEEQKGTDPFAFSNLPKEVQKAQDLGAAEVSMGPKEVTGRAAEFMKAARLSPDKGIRGFARGGGGGIGVAPPKRVVKKTREERVADNIAKGEAKLKKLKESGAGPSLEPGRSVWGNDAWRKQQEKLENMKALQRKLQSQSGQLPEGAVQPAAAAQQQKDIEAAKEAERKGIAQQKQEQEANLQARKNRKAQRRQGGAGGGEVAGGNVNEIVTALTGEQFAATVQNAFTAGGNYVGEQITQALKAIPSAIDLKAQLGPVTVNLTGGKILEELKNGILKEMHGAIKTAIDARFNADGSVKDTSTQSVVPRGPSGARQAASKYPTMIE